jgi:hypothetical protein
MGDLKIENLKEYRPAGPAGPYAVSFWYDCPRCKKRHEQGAMEGTPIMVVPVTAACGYTALVSLPEPEPE